MTGGIGEERLAVVAVLFGQGLRIFWPIFSGPPPEQRWRVAELPMSLISIRLEERLEYRRAISPPRGPSPSLEGKAEAAGSSSNMPRSRRARPFPTALY